MTDLAIIICVAIFLAAVIFGVDRHLILKQVETDLKEYLGDVLVAQSVVDDPLKPHFAAQVFALKSLIRKHFRL